MEQKLYCSYRLVGTTGLVFCKDEISEEILKSCLTLAEVKDAYMKAKGLSFKNVRNWEFDYPGADE